MPENIQWNKVTPPQKDKEGQNKTWDFDVQPNVEGIYKEKKENFGANKSNLYVFELASKELVSIWGSYALDEKMALLNIGDLVKIEYKGKKDLGGGKTLKEYEVYLGEL